MDNVQNCDSYISLSQTYRLINRNLPVFNRRPGRKAYKVAAVSRLSRKCVLRLLTALWAPGSVVWTVLQFNFCFNH
jgi:hypothetical protein